MDGGGEGNVDGGGEGNAHASFTSPCSHGSKGRDCAMSQTTSHKPDEAIQVRPLPHTPGGLVGVGVSAQHPEQLQPISCSSLQLSPTASAHVAPAQGFAHSGMLVSMRPSTNGTKKGWIPAREPLRCISSEERACDTNVLGGSSWRLFMPIMAGKNTGCIPTDGATADGVAE